MKFRQRTITNNTTSMLQTDEKTFKLRENISQSEVSPYVTRKGTQNT